MVNSIDKFKYRKSFHNLRNENPTRSWFHRWLPLNRRMVLNRRHDDILLDDLPAAENTIYTNAWAGTSQSQAGDEITPTTSPRNKDFIHVKQVICQQSELQI